VASDVSVARRPLAERVARWVLRVEDREPRALMPLQGSLAISAIRCLITYAVIPALAPVVSWLGPLAAPLSLLLSVVAVVMAVTSLRRVWLADWSHRWPYTAFIGAVLVALAVLIALDVRALLGG
jgi:hypothetical protein